MSPDEPARARERVRTKSNIGTIAKSSIRNGATLGGPARYVKFLWNLCNRRALR